MSGHSKWAQIKRQKGAKDVKRGLTFTKLSNSIGIAVRQGGGIGDPEQNFRLRLAIEAARSENMPKENIERAIERALGKQGAALDETVYEGFGPHGIALIVEAATDNKNRTTSEVQSIFNKNGGIMGQPGSVSYQFKQMGRIVIQKKQYTIDDIFLISADAGAEDIVESENEIIIYTSTNTLSHVRQILSSKGFEITEMELTREPINTITIHDQNEIDKVMNLIEKLEELDDVQKVFSNMLIEENVQ